MGNSFLALAGATAIALTATAAAAHAVPAGGAQLRGDTSVVQPVAYRKCWWHDGVRHCRMYGNAGVYGYSEDRDYDVGSRRPEEYRFGSANWWAAMDRDGRGGFVRR